MLQLYSNIKQRRLELGMTQTDLAKKMGYADKSMIAKIEKGKIDLPQTKIMAFAEALSTTASDLMGWDEGNNAAPTDAAVAKVTDRMKADKDYRELVLELTDADVEEMQRLIKVVKALKE